jgi:hypothetical protein
MNVTEIIAENLYGNSNSIGSRFRARRIAPLIDMISRVNLEKGTVDLLDVGGKPGYWRIIDQNFLRAKNVKITILNLPSGEPLDADDEIFRHVEGNACDLHEYAENSFDIVHSNSVLEHVGNWTNMKLFSKEVRRISKYMFIQTPHYWFPIEPHYMFPFFHWIPRPIQIGLIMKFALGNRGRASGLDDAVDKIEDAPILVDQRMMKILFPDCAIVKERVLLLTKSLIATKSH